MDRWPIFSQPHLIFIPVVEDSCAAALETTGCKYGFLNGFNHKVIDMRRDSCTMAWEKVTVEHDSLEGAI